MATARRPHSEDAPRARRTTPARAPARAPMNDPAAAAAPTLLWQAFDEAVALLHPHADTPVVWCSPAFADCLPLPPSQAAALPLHALCQRLEGLAAGIAELDATADDTWQGAVRLCTPGQRAAATTADGGGDSPPAATWLHATLRRLPDGALALRLLPELAHERATRRHLEDRERLLFTSRSVAVGEMATTLAHELNQPLAALVNYAAAARALAAQGKTGPLNDSLEALSAQALRAADIVGRIRRWVRQHPESREPCDLSAIVEQSLELLLRAEARRQGIAVRVEQAAAPLQVHADRVLLEQVVINLGLNALQAMQTHEPPPEGHELRLRLAADPGHALVQVLDRGPGLPPGIAERLFEPFFTTRSDGLGLGLNICRSIVESMGGELQARNRDGGGALFEIRLPLDP